jgi:hypothetical protein
MEADLALEAIGGGNDHEVVENVEFDESSASEDGTDSELDFFM